MMNFLPNFKEKSAGYYLVCVATLLALISTIMYLIFGIASATFSAGIFVCLLLATLLGVATMFYEGFSTDFFVFAMVVLFAVALGLLINNSVGDFAEFVTPVGMYGNPENMGMRFTLVGFIGVAMLVGIVGCFLPRQKKN